MCDACGVEEYSEVGEKMDGFFLSTLRVKGESDVVAEVYACTAKCLPAAVFSALKRAEMTPEEYSEEIRELYKKGRRS